MQGEGEDEVFAREQYETRKGAQSVVTPFDSVKYICFIVYLSVIGVTQVPTLLWIRVGIQEGEYANYGYATYESYAYLLDSVMSLHLLSANVFNCIEDIRYSLSIKL